jgi:hypothetical protein
MKRTQICSNLSFGDAQTSETREVKRLARGALELMAQARDLTEQIDTRWPLITSCELIS